MMDGRGGCCIIRGATGAHDMSTMERIMLKFRPIAPKPVVAGTTASDGTSSSESGDAFFKTGRTRRKYVKQVKQNNTTEKRRIRRKKTVSSPENEHPVPVTLPLLPETPDPKESPETDLTLTEANKIENNNMPRCRWLSFENRSKVEAEPYGWYGSMDQVPMRLGDSGNYSSVTVECVTEAWVDGERLGSTDNEKKMNLSVDTCPGFISDGYGRVTWINGAYREMMGEGVVALVMKVNGVRVVQFACGSGRERNSLTVPCDVWRMDCGGFAWRLDVKAALSLRLGC